MIGDIVAVRIAPEGWYAEFEIEGFAIGATYDFGLTDGTVPTAATPYFMVVSEGFDSAGRATTVTRKIYATIQQRKPTPNENQNEERVTNGRLVFQAVLSEFIYDDDKNGGPGTSGTDPVFHAPAGWVRSGSTPSRALVAGAVTNLSTLDYPVPIANWTRPDFERLTGYSVTTAAIGFHASGRGGRPLVCISFTATSGVHSTTVVVAEPRIESQLADAHPVIEYVGTLNLTGFTDNAIVAVNFKAYPLIGDADCVYDSTAGSATADVNHFTFPQSYLLDVAGTRGYPIAVVNPASGGPAGRVVGGDSGANRTTAAATPFATVAQALAGLSSYLAANHGRSNLAGATLYLASGAHKVVGGTQAAGVSTAAGGCWLTIKPLPGVVDAVLEPDAGSNSKIPAHAIKFENCTFVRSAAKPFGEGTGGKLLTLNCVLRDTRSSTGTDSIFVSPGTQWHVRSRFHRVQVTTSYFRGCSFPEGSMIGRRCFIVGCDWSDFGSITKLFQSSTGSNNTSDGMVMAFNAFWDCNAGVAEYPGVGEGTFLQGCAVVQNVFEQANGDGNRLIRMAGDGNNNVTNNCVVCHNTVVGELCNMFYNDESGPRHLHNGHVMSLNAVRSFGSKGDTFAGDSRCTGNWPVYHGCGLQGNRVQGGNFPTRFRGIYSRAGQGDPGDATFLNPGFINDASGSGSGLGHGNYRPASGSMLIAVPGPQMLRWDLDGLERAVPDASGAYRYSANSVPPAAPTGLRVVPNP